LYILSSTITEVGKTIRTTQASTNFTETLPSFITFAVFDDAWQYALSDVS